MCIKILLFKNLTAPCFLLRKRTVLKSGLTKQFLTEFCGKLIFHGVAKLLLQFLGDHDVLYFRSKLHKDGSSYGTKQVQIQVTSKWGNCKCIHSLISSKHWISLFWPKFELRQFWTRSCITIMYKYSGGSPAPLNAVVASDAITKNLIIISNIILEASKWLQARVIYIENWV